VCHVCRPSTVIFCLEPHGLMTGFCCSWDTRRANRRGMSDNRSSHQGGCRICCADGVNRDRTLGALPVDASRPGAGGGRVGAALFSFA